MLVKFFARGVGSGSGPVEYITRLDSPNTGLLREPAPEIIRGNPYFTQQLIDGLDFKYKYNSGVLSFATEDAPTEKEQQAIIDSFEAYAFAGINPDSYNTLWVRHTHTGSDRVELHFVTPKVELDTGKSLNIAPPGWHGYFKPWQTYWNIKQDWARPDDLERKRIYEPGYIALIDAENKRAGLVTAPDPKKQLTEYITKRIEAGLVTNRDHIVNSFTELGLEIPRQGENYITVLNPEDKVRYRLKGGIYEASWGLGGQFEKENRSPEQTPGGDSRTRTRGTETTARETKEQDLDQLQARIRELAISRANYHISRYGGEPPNLQKILEPTMDLDVSHSYEPLFGYLGRELGSDWILINADYPKSNPTRADRARNRATTVNFEPATEPDQGDKNKRNQQRNIYYPTPIPKTDPRVDVPGTTLSETGVNHERTREPTETVLSTASQRIQRTNTESVQQILRGYEAVRRAEQAATASSERLERTSGGITAANQQLDQLHFSIHRDFERGRRALERKRKEELEKFKTEINLVEYAQSQGYQYISQASSRNSAVLRHPDGDKIVVATDTDGHGVYFSVRDDADNGTIIDFIQNRQNTRLSGVRKELRDWLNKPRARGSEFIPRDKPQSINSDRLKIIKAASNFEVVQSHPYLEKRGIKQSILKSDRFLGTVAVDNRGNAIFPHYDGNGITGFTAKNENYTGFSKGGTKALWRSKPSESDRRLVIVESAIDAMSYHQLFIDKNSNTRYISTGGTISDKQLDLIKTAMTDMTKIGGEIVIATDNDKAGNKLAHTLSKEAPSKSKISRHVPERGKDWNELLQHSRQREITRHSQDRSRGWSL
ncbi:MAG: toprim domain-containing protein [Pleurocapsa sp. SU_5_0]|nr:toprim domain-containing protein [Pleurocapsa sp. SU_5_0]NJO96045.1 toprim domain-containing protein [Pleurocapsa sp. CRU_1_2]